MSRYGVTTYLEAEVKCLHCGYTSGVLRRDQETAGAVTIFQDNQGGPAVAVKSLTALRCGRCAGSVYTDEFDVRYVYPKIDFLDEERPRRGRPPKRLIQLRRAEEEALKSA